MKLSQLLANGTFKTVTAKESDREMYFLEDDMKNEAEYLLNEAIEKKLLPGFDVPTVAKSISYSLSYSQGDHVDFTEGTATETDERNGAEVNYRIERNGRLDYSFYGDYTEKQVEKWEKRAEEYESELKSICAKLKRFGYAEIERDTEWNNAMSAFQEFCEENRIQDEEFDSLSFDNDLVVPDSEKSDAFPVKIGGTTYVDAYACDFELIEHTRDIVEDGKTVRSEKFYSLA